MKRSFLEKHPECRFESYVLEYIKMAPTCGPNLHHSLRQFINLTTKRLSNLIIQPAPTALASLAMRRIDFSAKLVVIVWVCMAAVMVEGAGFLGKGSVTITNQLQQVVRVHCYSGDDDLGRLMLDPNKVYEFFFTPHLWGNTRFFCDFDSDAYGKGHIKAWEGWLWRQRHITCSHCRWDVTPTGFRCNGKFYYAWRPW